MVLLGWGSLQGARGALTGASSRKGQCPLWLIVYSLTSSHSSLALRALARGERDRMIILRYEPDRVWENEVSGGIRPTSLQGKESPALIEASGAGKESAVR